jgi:hypothetical protein
VRHDAHENDHHELNSRKYQDHGDDAHEDPVRACLPLPVVQRLSGLGRPIARGRIVQIDSPRPSRKAAGSPRATEPDPQASPPLVLPADWCAGPELDRRRSGAGQGGRTGAISMSALGGTRTPNLLIRSELRIHLLPAVRALTWRNPAHWSTLVGSVERRPAARIRPAYSEGSRPGWEPATVKLTLTPKAAPACCHSPSYSYAKPIPRSLALIVRPSARLTKAIMSCCLVPCSAQNRATSTVGTYQLPSAPGSSR